MPVGTQQRFNRGDLVRITDKMPESMLHFEHGCDAIIVHSYEDAFGSPFARTEKHQYRVLLENGNSSAWYPEELLTLVRADARDVADIWANVPINQRKELESIADKAVVEFIKKVAKQNPIPPIPDEALKGVTVINLDDWLPNEVIPSSNISNFLDYFDDHVEYPGDTVAGNPLPINEFWQYISSTFLDGFINYVDIIEGYQIHRYRAPDVTKRENFAKMSEFHSNLSVAEDDVLILADARTNDGLYYFFWFDRDVSDCCIGRFLTEDSREKVLENFRAYVNDRNAEMQKSYGLLSPKSWYEVGAIPPEPIPLEPAWLLPKLKGWISS